MAQKKCAVNRVARLEGRNKSCTPAKRWNEMKRELEWAKRRQGKKRSPSHPPLVPCTNAAENPGYGPEGQAARGAERPGVLHQSVREPHRAEEAGIDLEAQDSRLGIRRGEWAAERAPDRLQGALVTDAMWSRFAVFFVVLTPNASGLPNVGR